MGKMCRSHLPSDELPRVESPPDDDVGWRRVRRTFTSVRPRAPEGNEAVNDHPEHQARRVGDDGEHGDGASKGVHRTNMRLTTAEGRLARHRD